jgi:hypothetical protein
MSKELKIIVSFVVILSFIQFLNAVESGNHPSGEPSAKEFKDECCFMFK